MRRKLMSLSDSVIQRITVAIYLRQFYLKSVQSRTLIRIPRIKRRLRSSALVCSVVFAISVCKIRSINTVDVLFDYFLCRFLPNKQRNNSQCQFTLSLEYFVRLSRSARASVPSILTAFAKKYTYANSTLRCPLVRICILCLIFARARPRPNAFKKCFFSFFKSTPEFYHV